MSCNHCSTKFNFFHKEIGCSNCRLSFCSKCLKQKIKVPNKGDVELPVCKTCFSNLSTNVNVNTTAEVPPPDAYLKRLEELENPAAHPITVYKQDKKMTNLRTGLTPADQKLLDRLEKLKDKTTPPSEDEIRKRLNNLKGGNEYVEGPSNKTVLTAETKSDQEQIDTLLDMFVKERDIELTHNPEVGIEARLATLRGQGARANESSYITNLHDSGSDDEVDKVTKKIMDEVSLDEKCSNLLPKDTASDSTEGLEEKPSSSPELPWKRKGSDKDKGAPPVLDETKKQLNSQDGDKCVDGPNKNIIITKFDPLSELFVRERKIELAQNPQEGIEARLATLRGQGIRPNESSYITNLHDSGSDDEVDTTTKKIMDEVSLDDKCSDAIAGDVASNATKKLESPDLPWCVLCNNDATCRCLNCDGIYCTSCNVEMHKAWGHTDHRIIDYKQ